MSGSSFVAVANYKLHILCEVGAVARFTARKALRKKAPLPPRVVNYISVSPEDVACTYSN